MPVPLPPKALAGVAFDCDRTDLTWFDCSDDEDFFKLYRRASTGVWTTIARPPENATSYSDTAIPTPSTTYHYRITAVNSEGESVPSAETTVDTPACPGPPTAPSNCRIDSVEQHAITVAWNDNSSDELGFFIQISLDGLNFGTINQIIPANTEKFRVTALVHSTTYFFRVAAGNLNGISAYSNIAEGTTKQPPTLPPFAPIDLFAIDNSGEITCTWDVVATNQNGFALAHSPDGRIWTDVVPNIDPTLRIYKSRRFPKAVTNYFRLRAFNSAGVSEWSNTAITVQASLPAGGGSLLIAQWHNFVTIIGEMDDTTTPNPLVIYTTPSTPVEVSAWIDPAGVDIEMTQGALAFCRGAANGDSTSNSRVFVEGGVEIRVNRIGGTGTSRFRLGVRTL